MKINSKVTRAVAVALGGVLAVGSASLLTGCVNPNDALIIMTEDLNGLFNPFFSTSGTDMDVVGQTQISMLTTDKNGNIAYGENEAVVVKDYQSSYNSTDRTTEYTFVIKNGIKFSDGVPLTMNDILFNMYVYLDPAYTGSSTMYSTDIVGLQKYRTQRNVAGDGSSEEDALTKNANGRANNRRNELINVFHAAGKTGTTGSYDADAAKMTTYISTYTPSSGYMSAIGETDVAKARQQLQDDYDTALEKFETELGNDYNSAKDSYTEEPYSKVKDIDPTGKGFDEITSFMYAQGFVTLEYGRDANNKIDKNNIIKITRNYNQTIVTNKESAIKYVYDATVAGKFDQIMQYWGTAQEMMTEFIAKARDVILHEQLGTNGMIYKNIEGITSLGHLEQGETSVTVNGHDYTVAREHNEDGTPANEGEYDVLRVKINGVDPKAVWNFGFSVAPYHYYSDTSKYSVDIKNNQFGVEWGSFDFMTGVIQGTRADGIRKNKVPLGAGPYIATDRDTTTGLPGNDDFFNSTTNMVYYRANESFVMGKPKIEKMRYAVVSSSNALGRLQSDVHFVTPQFTKANADALNGDLKNQGYGYKATWQLGYGYIGINAGKVTDINLRKAIMSAMQTSLALGYYTTGTARTIAWPMSLVSWAYPKQPGASSALDAPNNVTGKDYMTWTNENDAKQKIQKYTQAAGAQEGDSRLTVKFTIAGANLSEHPTFNVFKQAMDLLNACGWNVEVVPDTNALIKLSTGSLAVWAAAWGSTIDPDMYQVYHKNSTATSTYSWGYREILADSSRTEENRILTDLSGYIDDARETDDQARRTDIYKTAMGLVLDLAVELPVYQRQVLYAYNAKVIDESTFPEEINSYTSPLGRIWEIDFVK